MMSTSYIARVIARTSSYHRTSYRPKSQAMPSTKRKQQNRDAQRRYRRKKKDELEASRSAREPTLPHTEVSSIFLPSPSLEPIPHTRITRSTVVHSQGKLLLAGYPCVDAD